MMSLAFILVNGIGLLLIVAVWWWFFGSKVKTIRADTTSPINILVKDGIYQPAQIEVPANQPITLSFLRRDATPCSEYVIFEKLQLSQKLPLNEKTIVTLPKLGRGEFIFTCQMGMYRGKIVVSE